MNLRKRAIAFLVTIMMVLNNLLSPLSVYYSEGNAFAAELKSAAPAVLSSGGGMTGGVSSATNQAVASDSEEIGEQSDAPTSSDSIQNSDARVESSIGGSSEQSTSVHTLTKTITVGDEPAEGEPDLRRTYTVQVKYDEYAEVPEGAEIEVTELEAKDERDKALRDQLKLEEDERVVDETYLRVVIKADGKDVQPTTPVEVVVETKSMTPSYSDAVEAVVLGENDISVTVQNLTGERDDGEEDEEPEATKLKLTTSKLGEFGLATVVAPFDVWEYDGQVISLLGPRTKSVEANDTLYEDEEADGKELLRTVVFTTDPAHAWHPTLWAESRFDEGHDATSGAVSCYRWADGQVEDEVFDASETSEPVEIASDGEYAFLHEKATGAREQSGDEEDGDAEGTDDEESEQNETSDTNDLVVQESEDQQDANGNAGTNEEESESTKSVTKRLTGLEGSWASWEISINKDGSQLNNASDLILKDTFTESQSIDYSSISAEGVASYDYSGNTGTYFIPDETPVTISYRTRIKAQPGDVVEFGNTAQLLDSESNVLGEATINETHIIYPSASEISGSTDEYMVKLYTYGNPNMKTGVGDARFILLDANQRPITYRTGEHAGESVTFTTKENGYVAVPSDPDLDEFSIEKNTSYYLEMIKAPEGYKQDSTLYNFMISDDPDYDSGGVRTYYNGDTMKVRLLPEEASLNVSVRFSGNYSLTDDQKNNVDVILEKKAEGTWEEIERHAYSEFQNGSLTFSNGTGEPPFVVGATYRVKEENEKPWDLPATILTDTAYHLIIGTGEAQNAKEPIEFTVTEDAQNSSFNAIINNEYEEPKLTLIKMDKRTGTKLEGAVFTVKTAVDDQEVTSYTTDADGSVIISGGAAYESEVLYYAVETTPPSGYLLPLDPVKVYFYFCNDPDMEEAIKADLPEGATAVNLTKTYETLTIDNQKELLTIPVMKTWQGNAWPENIAEVEVGLYKSVGGATPEAVKDEQGQNLTVVLTKDAPYSKTAFVDLPARDGNNVIAYSIKEEHVYTEDNEDIIDQYVQEYGVSDSGIYIVRNKLATSLKVEKEWYKDGVKVEEASALAEQSDIAFDVYRTTQKIDEEVRTGDVTNEEMTNYVKSLNRVRSGISIGNADGWTKVVEGLVDHDDSGKAYYYYVLETVPNFGDESYVPDEDNKSIAIKNQVAPQRVELTVKLNELVEDTRPESANKEFAFTLALQKGTHAIRSYQVADGYTTDWNGIVSFKLKPTKEINLSLPVGVTATVTEEDYIEYIEEASSEKLTNLDSENRRVFKYDVTEDTNSGVIAYTNTLRAVCKVTDVNGRDKPFESLKSALRYIRENSNYYHGSATIEMLEDYDIPKTDVFDVQANENITLTTANTDNAQTFYFKTDRIENIDTAIITRGESGTSMLTNAGTLALGKVILDGAKDNSLTATTDGGLINNTGTLTLSEKTVLRNSTTTGKGGAIYTTGTVNMPSGTITGNAAQNGGAIYLADGTISMSGGTVSGNASINGGAIAVENADVRVHLSKAPVIDNNTNAEGSAANLYIGVDSNKVIDVEDPGLYPAAIIGVTASNGHREIGEQFAFAAMDATENLECFVNDESAYRGKLKDGTTTSVVWNGLTMTLKKIVDPVGANENDTFTITLTSAAIKKKSYTIDGNLDNTITAADGSIPGSIELRGVKANDEITISPLGAGEYTIVETATEGDLNYTPSYKLGDDTLESGAFDFGSNSDSTVSVTNTRRLSTVNLSKSLDDRLAGDDAVQFPFTVKLIDHDGTAVSGFALYTDEDNPANSIITDDSGEATFNMSPTNKTVYERTFQAPVGASMTITETDKPAYRITSSVQTKPAEGETATEITDTDDAANIVAFTVTDDGADVSFTNERKMADIVLSKELFGKVSATESFDFVVTLKENGSPVTKYPLYIDKENPNNNITTDSDKGEATIHFDLERGESSKDSTLTVPEGIKLEVKETEVTKIVSGTAQAIYNTSYSINGGLAQTGRTATINSVYDTDKSIAFTNTRKMKTIKVTNTVNGYSGNEDPFKYTATVTDGNTDVYNDNGFINGRQVFELSKGQSYSLIVPYGAQMTIKETFVVGYETTIKHGSATVPDPEGLLTDEFAVTADAAVTFTNNQLIGLRLVNNASTAFKDVKVTVGNGKKIFLVNEDRTRQTPLGTTTATLDSIAPNTIAILEVQHTTSATAEQAYIVEGKTPTDGYYYTINNEPSFHESADPAVMHIYNVDDYKFNGTLRYSVADSTITFTDQPLVSYDANGGAWTTEMEGYHDPDGNRQTYQYAVNKGDKAPKPNPDPVYPTAEGIVFLGWTVDKAVAEGDHAADDENFDGHYDFNADANVVNEPVTLYAVWKKNQSENRTVTLENGTGAQLTVSVTCNNAETTSPTIEAGSTENLSVPNDAKLVLSPNPTNVLATSEQFTLNADSENNYTIDAVQCDGTVAFTSGICKITDADGNILYKANGTPAVYTTLSAAFTDYNGTLYTTAEHTTKATQACVKMLVDEYAIVGTTAITFPKTTMTLTTAGKNDAQFPYVGMRSRSTIYRSATGVGANCFTLNSGSVTLADIILDGGSERGIKVNDGVNGALINVTNASATLTITTGTTLRNVEYAGYSSNANGGALYVTKGEAKVEGGLFSNLHARRGGAICVTGGQLSVTGTGIRFEQCDANASDGEGDGGAIYYNVNNVSKPLTINGGADKDDPGVVFVSCVAVGNKKTGKNENKASGGAIYVATSGNQPVSISGCRFTECSARTTESSNTANGGGAICANFVKGFEVTGCSFTVCDTLSRGGAIVVYILRGKTVSIISSDFDRCNCKGQGGALAVYQNVKEQEGNPPSEDSDIGKTKLVVDESDFTNCSSGTDNGSGGAIQCYVPCMEFTNSTFTDCWAGKEGGAVNNYFGNGYNALWNGSYMKLTGCTFTRCRAEDRFEVTSVIHYGGAVNTKVKTVNVIGGTFTDCVSTLRDGGALHLGGCGTGTTATITSSTFTGCMAKRHGGAVFSSAEMLTINGNSTFTNCASTTDLGGAVYHGMNCRTEKNIKASTSIDGCRFDSCSAAVNGGAVWSAARDASITNCAITGCTAESGGAIYLSKKDIQNSLNGSRVEQSLAQIDVTKLNDKLARGTITGGSITNCQATNGSAVYVGDSAVFSGVTIGGEEIDDSKPGNTCYDVNSGAIHADATYNGKMYFEGNTVVKNNTCSADSAYKHDVLMQNDNVTTIYTTGAGLGKDARIGVYTTEGLSYNNHGQEAQPFGTYSGSNYLDSFFNDRVNEGEDPLEGYQASSNDTNIYWGRYLCKITDKDGNTLKRTEGRDAIYQRISVALDEFTSVTNDNGETGKAVYIKMMVPDYPVKQDEAISNFPDANITITTAGENDSEYRYRGAEGTVCTIYRTDNKNNALFKLENGNGTLKFENITLDGRVNRTGDQGSYRLVEATSGKLEINNGTTMQYGYRNSTTNRVGGGAIYATNASVTINGAYNGDTKTANVQFKDCVATGNANGGAIYASTLTINPSEDGQKPGTAFDDCNAIRGGAIYVDGTSPSIDAALFNNCQSDTEGGAVYHNNTGDGNEICMTVRNSEFVNCHTTENKPWGYGGAIASKAPNLTVNSCAFTDCYAGSNGGAVFHGDANKSATDDSHISKARVKTSIVDSTFTNCETKSSDGRFGFGGSVCSYANTVELTGGSITGSKATNHGGALYCYTGSATTVSGTSFSDCSTTYTDGCGGAIYSKGTSLTLNGTTTINNCTAPAKSGAVHMEAGTLDVKGSTVISSCYANQGGAIYLQSNVTMNLSESPEFTKNGRGSLNGIKVTDGACIYLEEGSTLNLSGSPKFSLNNLTDVPRVTNGGITDYARQDIYLAGYKNEQNASSIHVVNELTGNTVTGNTIWVWPENEPHRLPGEQFATVEEGVSAASLLLLRNALPDGDNGTLCSNGEYLAGVRLGSDKTNVYWSKMYNIRFQKKDNKDAVVSGAEFTIYSDSECSSEVKKATSADGVNDKDAQGERLDKGVVDFVSIPIGVYYMKETHAPTGYKQNDATYLVLVGTPALSSSGLYPDLWTNGNVLDVPNANNLVTRSTVNVGKYYGIFEIKNGKADLSANLASNEVGIIDIRDGFEAYFMKTDDSGVALPGAQFTIYKQTVDENGTPQTFENGYPKLEPWKHVNDKDYPKPVTSADGSANYKKLNGDTMPKGLVYFPELPSGMYFVAETHYPERNGNNKRAFFLEDDRIFRLTVNGENSFVLDEWQVNGSYKSCDQDDEGYYVIDNQEVVCKITNEDDELLYELGLDGKTFHPAIYTTLVKGFEAAQRHTLYDAEHKIVSDCGKNTALKLKCLKDFIIDDPIVFNSARSLTFTTAELEKPSQADRYVFVTTRTTNRAQAEIRRNYDQSVHSYSNANDGALITVSAANSSLTLQNINLNGQKKQFNGRAIHVTNGSLLINSDTTIQNFKQEAAPNSVDNNDVKGGAVLMEDGTTLTIDGGAAHRTAILQNNEVKNLRSIGSLGADGGAIAICGNCNVRLSNAQFIGNTASAKAEKNGNGGAIGVNETSGQSEQAKLPMTNVVFRDNEASYQGGAIRVSENSDVTVSNGIFANNKSNTANTSTNPGEGGAIAVLSNANNRSNLTITGGSFTGNSAANGGAVKIGGYGTLTLDGNLNMSGNSAGNGGAVTAAPNATVKFNEGTIHSNTASGNGGGIYVDDGAKLNMTDGTIRNNTAERGGGIFAQGIASAEASASIVITGGIVSENTATNNGGGLYLGDKRKLSMEDVTLSGNKTTATTAIGLVSGEHNGSGGAIYLRPNTNATLDNCTLTRNDAYRAGGGIMLFNGASLTMEDSTLSENISACGGAIGALHRNRIEISDTYIYNNEAVTRSEPPKAGSTTIYHQGCGGGIGYQSCGGGSALTVRNGGVGKTSGGKVSGNTAVYDGGGIYLDGGTSECVLDGTNITGNTATRGGGVFSGSITARNGTKISGNYATKFINNSNIYDINGAGGLYLNSGTLVLGDSVEINDNYTGYDGVHSAEILRSDVHLPTIGGNNEKKNDNKRNSIELESNFTGKVRVTNPGRVYTQFGTSPYNYMEDISDPARWTESAIVSEDGSELFGRIDQDDYHLYWWQLPFCKITDAEGNLLYTDTEGRPAVYMRLYDDKNDASTAIGTLNHPNTIILYDKNGEPYGTEQGAEFCIKMLADYEMKTAVEVTKYEAEANGRVITLTTAEPKPEDTSNTAYADGYWYRGNGSTATITPSATMANGTYDFMFRLYQDIDFTLQNIVLDGGAEFNTNEDGTVRKNQDGTPSIKEASEGSFISTKDGFLMQLSGDSKLTLDDGAVLQNAYTTHMWGGAAIAFGYNGSNNRTLTINDGSKIIRCGAQNNGGAISTCPSGRGGTIVINGGSIVDCWSASNGGALYSTNYGVRLTVAGGTIQGCVAAENGGGIYLDNDAKISIQGNPVFESNYSTDPDLSPSPVNGGQSVYTGDRARTDIFLANISGRPAEAITLTGNIWLDTDTNLLTEGKGGSIWVWCDNDRYKQGDQFAVVADGVSVSEESYRVFRNARDDETAKNSSDSYLTGKPGAKINERVCVYWGPIVGGSRKVILRKIASDTGKSLADGKFQIRKGSANGEIVKGVDINGDTVDGTTRTEYVSGESGVFYVGELNYGRYYVVETHEPDGYSKPTSGYFIIDVSENGVEYQDA